MEKNLIAPHRRIRLQKSCQTQTKHTATKIERSRPVNGLRKKKTLPKVHKSQNKVLGNINFSGTHRPKKFIVSSSKNDGTMKACKMKPNMKRSAEEIRYAQLWAEIELPKLARALKGKEVKQ
jgi:hypothetical protein